MGKYHTGDYVELKNGENGVITFVDSARNQYVVDGDNGKEYYPRESGIVGKVKPAKKKGFFRRR